MTPQDRAFLTELFQAAVRAADPRAALRAHLPARPKGRVVVIGAGKGAAQLAAAFEDLWDGPLTGVVVVIPSLFLGSLLLESFFGIPGLGSYTIDAIAAQDFAVVRTMVFLGSVLYLIGLILTDLSYTLVDPRIRLK